MLHFENDYNKGAHPALMEALVESNLEGLSGYGTDKYTLSASQKIREAAACPHAQVTFLAGGTQTNQIVISSMLASYQGVIAADTGHIAVHEAGAIEYSGHKVLTLPHKQGKLEAAAVKNLLEGFYADTNHAHMVYPGMVYISHPTEYGSLYSKAELTELAAICRYYNIPLFMDGARLGYALASSESDLDLQTIAELTDVFYIGGTKLGALLGEAVVFTKNNQPKHFVTIIKHHGALLAKGRVVGVQFDRFFTDGLYQDLGRHAIEMAEQLVEIIKEKGIPFYYQSPTNQQFILLANDRLPELAAAGLGFSFWEKYDDQTSVVRLATSWSTSQADLDQLGEIL